MENSNGTYIIRNAGTYALARCLHPGWPEQVTDLQARP